METNYRRAVLRVCATAVLLALFTGCSRPPKPGEPNVSAPADTTPAAPPSAPSNGEPGSELPAPGTAEPAPSPTPDAPPPADPSPVPKPTANHEPSLESMHAAIPSAKISVPVDLRYQFDGEALPNQPVTLHLAAVSRVAGQNLHVAIRQMDGVQLASGPLEVQKTAVSGIYRQQLSVTRSASGPDHLRVLVTMDLSDGNGFGYFTVPFTAGNPAQKLQSVKQR